MDPDSSPLRVSVSDGRGRPVADGGLARWLARVAPAGARGEVAIALVSDARMRILNRSYRSRDYATDVLSFSALAGPRAAALPSGRSRGPQALPGPRTPDPGTRSFGDIVIARGVARRQARETGHSYQAELRVLALHGLLHLLGYDHDNRANRGRMARAEARLRRHGGLGAGLIERGASRPPSEAKATRPKAARARSARTRPGAGRRGHRK